MRNANYDMAASVLRQCGNSITMLVQYNPDSKYSVPCTNLLGIYIHLICNHYTMDYFPSTKIETSSEKCI